MRSARRSGAVSMRGLWTCPRPMKWPRGRLGLSGAPYALCEPCRARRTDADQMANNDQAKPNRNPVPMAQAEPQGPRLRAAGQNGDLPRWTDRCRQDRFRRRLGVEDAARDSERRFRNGVIAGSTSVRANRRQRCCAPRPHWLIDIRDPREPYSAAEFARDALQAMQAIRAKGRLPLLVGGTFLYLRALRDGLSSLPTADPAVRQRLESEIARDGLGALHERLRTIDAQSGQSDRLRRYAADHSRARGIRDDPVSQFPSCRPGAVRLRRIGRSSQWP